MNTVRTLALVSGLALSFSALASEPVNEVVLDVTSYQSTNGSVFKASKVLRGTEELWVYERDGRRMTREEMRAWEIANPAPVIDPPLLEAAAKAPAGQIFEVRVLLRDNPAQSIKREIRREYDERLREIGRQQDELVRKTLPVGFMDPMQEENWLAAMRVVGDAANDPTRAERDRLARQYETLTGEMKRRQIAAVAIATAQSQAGLARLVTQLGGEIKERLTIINGAIVRVPASQLGALAADPSIARIYYAPPAQLELDLQKTSLGLTTGFWGNGFQNTIWDPGVIDSGCQQDHPTFTGKTFLEAPGTGIIDTDGHGTAVTSIVCGGDTTRTGMAPGTETILIGNGVLESNADWMVTTATAIQGDSDAEVINTSLGYGVATDSDYNDMEKFIDALIDDETCAWAKSTGNEGDGTTTITHPANAYNLMAVANVYDLNTTTRTDDEIRSTSSRGPTLLGRKKPDISAPGHNTQAANNSWATSADWIDFTGTSAAAPHVAGAVLLLIEASTTNENPTASKAILLNTADTWTDAGTSGDSSDDGQITGREWNKTYGWGYMDLGAAYLHRVDRFIDSVDDGMTPSGPDFKLYRGTMTNGEKATLVWNRHLTYIGTSTPTAIESLTDLDLLAYAASNGAQLDNGHQGANNVEQVTVTSTTDTVLKVDVFGSVDPEVGVESYTLATQEGFTAVDPPSFGGALLPDEAHEGSQAVVRVIISNLGDVPAHNVNVTLTLPAGWTIASGANPQNIGTISDGGFLPIGIAEYTVNIPCGAVGSPTVSWTVSSTCYGETFTGGGSETINLVSPIALAENVPQSFSEVSKTLSFLGAANEFNWVAIQPGTADLDIKGDADPCFNSVWQSSTFGGTTRDFLVVNGYTVAQVTQYANVFRFSGDVPTYSVEYDRGFDTSLSGSVINTWETTEVVEPYEVSLVAGRRYKATATVTSGNVDVSMFVYPPATTFSRRALASANVNAAGPAGLEALYFTAVASGVHAIGLINENTQSGTTTFTIRCAADFNGVDGLTVQDIFDFLNAWFALSLEADFDDSGALAPQDIFDFLNAWFAGC